MNKRFRAAVLLPVLLAACGGGDDGDGGGEDFEFDGFFTGTLTPDGGTARNAFLYVTQDGQFYVNATQKALFAGSGDVNGVSYSASGMGLSISGTPFQNGSGSAAFNFNGAISGGGGSLTGAYSGANESGTYQFNWDTAVSSRDASLGAIQGTYAFPATGTPTFTFTVSSTGAFSLAWGGCTMTGEIDVLDRDWNYYGWEASASNCFNKPGLTPVDGHVWMLSADQVILFGTQATLPVFFIGARTGS